MNSYINILLTCEGAGEEIKVDKMKKQKEKPLIGFFPVFHSIGETIPHVKIAQSYMEKGGRAIFFSHGGKYEYLAKEIGCEVIKLTHLWKGFIEEAKRMEANEVPFEELIYKVYRKGIIETLVNEEKEVLKRIGVKLVVSSFNPTCSISTRILNIPLVVLISGTTIPPYYKSGFVTFPENYENFFTKILPSSLKNTIARWYLLNNRILVNNFNRVAKENNVKTFTSFNDLLLGDHTFICDDINLLGIKPTLEFPLKNYIGPIAGDLFEKQKNELDTDVNNLLGRPGKKIFFVMGSTCLKPLFLKILETLNQTDFNVIAVYTTILNREDLPITKANILLKQFVTSPLEVHKKVDLAIIHGGRGTIYTAAYAGKPVIGIPMFLEHQYNIDNLVRHGSAIRISMKFFTPQELSNAINNIFSNYDSFLTHAQQLAAKLTREAGEKKAAQRLIEILQPKTER